MMIHDFHIRSYSHLSVGITLSVLIMQLTQAIAQDSLQAGTEGNSESYKTRYDQRQSRFYTAQQDFIQSYLSDLQQSQAAQLRFDLDALMNPGYNLKLPVYPELHRPRIEKELARRTGSGSASVTISPLVFLERLRDKKKWKTGSEQIRTDIIPSNLQLEVLKSLWENSEATGMEIYAGLDPGYPMTAEGLNLQLLRMMDLGLVERKIVSPQNLFMIFTPLKTFQIEQSGLNRRNRVFVYRARIDQGEMVRVLLDRTFVLRNEEGASRSELQRLNEKIGIIAPGGGGE